MIDMTHERKSYLNIKEWSLSMLTYLVVDPVLGRVAVLQE